MRKLAVMAVAAVALFVAPSAQAAIDDVFDGTIACVKQTGGATDGQRWCGTGQHNANNGTRSTVKSFDGVPIDVNVAFPDEGDYGDGPFPLVYIFHGYGGGKINFSGMQRWLNRGYAVFSQTNRGFHESCGTASSKAADPVCQEKGFVRLDDTRYEVADAQLFAGILVDENRVLPNKIAATGGSYGGGMSMALAALKNRVMLPNGEYAAWKSPEGEVPMSLAVATPNIPWTDLAYSLVPNGSNIDYLKDASYFGPFGVMKQSYVNGLYLSGQGAPGYYTPPGQEPSADLAGWKDFLAAGEPYQGTPEADAMLEEITTHHSSYYIDHSQAPAPLLISSGFTDDLFPANEATRYYNRTRAQFPDSPIGLFFGSFGHPRGQNGAEVNGALTDLENKWVDYYLSDQGTKPPSDVTTYTQVCPNDAPDGGPYVTDNWVDQSPGEIRQLFRGDTQTVAADGGDRTTGSLFNPITGTACNEAPGSPEPGTASYETSGAPAGGYTVMGAATVIAKVTQAGDDSQLAFRLVDVSADGQDKILVARTVYRSPGDGLQVIQLNSNGWHVDQGHKLRLEVLPFDGGQADPNHPAAAVVNYSRPSNNQQPATLEDVDLRIPVVQSPGSLNGLVKAPAKRVLPDRPEAELAPGNEAIGSQSLEQYRKETYPVIGKIKVKRATVKGKLLTARITCAGAVDRCARATVRFRGAPKRGKGKGVVLASKNGVTVQAGKTSPVKFKLTARARKLFKDSKKRVRKRGKVRVVKVKGLKQLRARVLIAGKSSGFVNVKRNGKVR